MPYLLPYIPLKLIVIYCILFAALTAQHKLAVIVFHSFFVCVMCMAHSQCSHRFPCLEQKKQSKGKVKREKTIRHINKTKKQKQRCNKQKNDCYKFYKCCCCSCFCSEFFLGWRHIRSNRGKKW